MRYFVPLLFLLFLPACKAQPAKPPRRAENAFKEAVAYFNSMRMKEAIASLNQAVAYYPDYMEARLMRAELLTDQGDLDGALKDLQHVTWNEPQRYARILGVIANLYREVAQMDSAIASYERLKQVKKLSEESLSNVNARIEELKIAAALVANPVPFSPQNMGAGVNSEFSEYHPSFTVDGSEMVFTVLGPNRGVCPNSSPSRLGEDFYTARRENGKFGNRRPLPAPVNTGCNEGAGCISPDGRYLFFAADYSQGMGGMDIYYSERIEGLWGPPQNLGPKVNSRFWESQPALASDGKTLYFASTRPGGLGAEDIYVCTWLSDGSWTEPKNLGPAINTPGKDFSPYIHPDNQTLYFASNGHPGVGGVDLFRSVRRTDGSWSVPENMGYPLNTPQDERSLSVSADGRYGYYASDAPGGFGKFDLYQFEMPENMKPVPVTWLSGKVVGEGKPLQANLELIDLESGETVIFTRSTPGTGEFLMPLHTGKSYALNIESAGFLFHSESVHLKSTTPETRTVTLEPLKPGKTLVLRNVYFDTDQSVLKPESRTELKRLVTLLQKNPELKIEIQGHTDNRGGKAHNQQLSESRAAAVKTFLVEQGIATNRLNSKGYGDSRPIADNGTEEGRAKNRRTQIEILP
jgi:outer membrane protein OmpA-like peptidoglycan-associated protein/Tol biopolymer transport system component